MKPVKKKIQVRVPFERLTNVDDVRVIEVVRVRSLVGEGDENGTPKRQITEYFATSGERLARHDPLLDDQLEIGTWTDAPKTLLEESEAGNE